MKVGDLVKSKGRDTVGGRVGIVVGIDRGYYGARQAFKMIPRDRAQKEWLTSPSAIARATKKIELGRTATCDRVLVMFRDNVTPEYYRSTEFEVISEGG